MQMYTGIADKWHTWQILALILGVKMQNHKLLSGTLD